MRRPLAFFCSLIVIFITLLVLTGVLPLHRNVTLPEDGETVTVTGTVEEIYEKYIVIKTDRVKLMIRFSQMPDVHMGEFVKVQGRFALFSHAMNPGQFDAYEYYTGKGYAGSIRQGSLLERGGRSAPVSDALRRIRLLMKSRIYKVCPEREAPVMCDLLLGDREGIDEGVKELFRDNGIAHILSISGLHISILGMGCFELLRKLKQRHIPAAFVSSAVLTLYLVMTGMSVSATRAVGMFVIRMFAYPAKRTADPLTSLSLMAAMVLIISPGDVKNVSFLLSYGAALGIYTFLPAMDSIFFSGEKKERFYVEATPGNRVGEMVSKLGKGTLHSLVASMGITLFTLPVQLYFYYRVCIYAPVLNLLILPCMSVLVLCGIVMLIPGMGILGKVCCLLLKVFEILCRVSEKLPHHTWNPGRPGMMWIVFYYAMLLMLLSLGRLISAYRCGYILRMLPYFDSKGKRRIDAVNSLAAITDRGRIRPALVFAVSCCCIMLFLLRFPLPAENSFTQLYVGQGNCNVTVTDAGEIYVFDAGSTSEKEVGKYIILPFLRYEGMDRIDAIFISHSDEDHMNGCLELIENRSDWGLEIGEVFITPQMARDGTENTAELIRACRAAGVMVKVISAGDEWNSGSTHFTCLHPDESYVPEDPNSGSMCILAEFERRRNAPVNAVEHADALTVLIPGDVQGSGEEALTYALGEALAGRRLDIYITAHHGSSGSTTEEFLAAAHPRLAINSAGLGNRYGHPSPETLVRLEAAGCTYLTTYETGAVIIRFADREIIMTSYREE